MSNDIKIELIVTKVGFIEIIDDREESSILYGRSLKCSTCYSLIITKTYFKPQGVTNSMNFSSFMNDPNGKIFNQICPACFKQLKENSNEFKFKYQHGLL